MKTIQTLIASAVVLLAAGCASGPDLSGSGYDAGQGQVRADTRVINATVLRIREVNITKPAQQGTLGTVVGGVLGAALGSQAGGGNGRTLTTMVGGVAGAAVGHELAQGGSVVKGWEIVVRSDAGNTTSITQAADGYPLSPGQRVMVMVRGDTMRVTPAQ